MFHSISLTFAAEIRNTILYRWYIIEIPNWFTESIIQIHWTFGVGCWFFGILRVLGVLLWLSNIVILARDNSIEVHINIFLSPSIRNSFFFFVCFFGTNLTLKMVYSVSDIRIQLAVEQQANKNYLNEEYRKIYYSMDYSDSGCCIRLYQI